MAPRSPRDPRLDVFRGLALVMIFINHVPGNLWEDYTSRNFGLSDAAEGFVLIAGISAGLAYGSWFRPGAGTRNALLGAGHVWHRVWTVYLVQMAITLLALGSMVGLARHFGNPAMLYQNALPAFMADPAGAMVRIPLLAQHLHYVDILPMYILMLAAAPLLLPLAGRWPRAVLAAALALWAAANAWAWNLPNYRAPEGWFFNPLAWQLLFVIGMVAGLAMRDGRRLVPRHWSLQLAGTAALVFAAVWASWPPLGDVMYGLLWQAGQNGWPLWLVGLEKTYLPLPRLLHVLVLAYVLASSDIVRRFCASAVLAPFALLGRQGLPVFAAGSVIAVALQTIRIETGTDPWRDTFMVSAGLAVLFALAGLRQVWPDAARRSATD